MSATNDPKQEKKTRPSIEIYRPPSLRFGTNQPSVESSKISTPTRPIMRKESDQLSNASSESQNSTKKTDRPKPPKEPVSRSKKVVSKEEIVALVQKLGLSNEKSIIDDFVESINSSEVASRLAYFISRHAIEENKQNQRVCSHLCAALMDCPTGQSFYSSLTASLNQYFCCAENLRLTHFRVWQNFLNFLSDLYANVGYRFENELADIIFKVFNYMLKAPTLNELRIEELECLIGILLNLGYELERDCPSELSTLKNLVRDALILANESWSRKMVLLMVELSASNFTLPTDANEYYFQ